MVVSRCRVTVAIGAVLLWAVTPALACVLPCLANTPAKQECPRHVAMRCGHSMISAGRTCCQMSSRPETATVETRIKLQKRVLAMVAVVVRVSPPEATPQPASLAFLESPPHEALPPSCSVLRI